MVPHDDQAAKADLFPVGMNLFQKKNSHRITISTLDTIKVDKVLIVENLKIVCSKLDLLKLYDISSYKSSKETKLYQMPLSLHQRALETLLRLHFDGESNYCVV